jgi:esterase
MLLNYHEFGQGRPLIILHGLFGSARNWQGIARALSGKHHVLTPDLRNHGLSPHTDTMSYQDMSDDIIEFIDRLDLDNVIILGHSMGGKVAMTATLLYPKRFSALAVIDIAPIRYQHDFARFTTAMNALKLDSLKNRIQAEETLRKVTDDIGIIQLLSHNLVRSENSFKWRFNLEGIEANLSLIAQFPDSLKNNSFYLPSLFLGGTESNYLHNIDNTVIYDYFPTAKINMIRGAGHWPHTEKPNEFLKYIKNFINSV